MVVPPESFCETTGFKPEVQPKGPADVILIELGLKPKLNGEATSLELTLPSNVDSEPTVFEL